uniref:Uncharacterized protein n=1 Tax=Anopheles quadriannulatus TaxID=34691 RepID=A0A182XLA4_ANOQN
MARKPAGRQDAIPWKRHGIREYCIIPRVKRAGFRKANGEHLTKSVCER